jgi:tetratricopeptide (TPR) repeat protein
VHRRRAAELEWHFTHANAPDRALPYAVLVGDQAEAVFAHGDAATHYRTALELAQQLGHQAAEAEVREKLGGLYTATIEYPRALEMLEQAARMYRELGDRESEARVTAQIGRVQLADGLIEEGISRLQAAVQSIVEGSPRATPRGYPGLHSSLARLLFSGGRHAESLAAADLAAELASAEDIKGVLAEARVTGGSALAMLGRWSQSLNALTNAIQTAEETGDVFSACRGLQYLSGVYLARGQLDASRQRMERALQLSEQMDNRRQIATTTFGLSINAFLIGELDRSTALAEQALELMHSLGGFWLHVLYSAGLSLALSAGEWEIAPPALKECINIGETRQVLPALRVQRLLAERDLLAGHPEEALSRLTPMLGNPILAEQETAGLLPLLAWAYLETGGQARAEASLTHGMEHAAAEHLQMAQLALWRVQGMVRARQGHWSEASRIFEEAAALARTMPYPYAEGRILYEWGLAHHLKGEDGAAQERLASALAIFQRLGAAMDAERTEQALRELTG